MSTCRTCEPIQDCNDALDQYSLQDSVFFWTLNCPPGFFCGGRDRLYLDCCDGTRESVVFPDGATAAERAALVNGLVTRCLRKAQLCDTQPPPPPDETELYYNTPQSCSGTCPDGSSVTVTIPAGLYSAFTQAEADAAAKEAACAAVSAPICLEDWSLACCVKKPASKRIHATGSVANWMISSGSLPTGMMISGGTTTSVLISGTPQSTGTYTFTLRAVGTNGSVTQKSYSIIVCGITTVSPLTDGMVGEAYSQQLTQYGLTGAVWSLTNPGDLPDGMTFSSGGLISGTPTEAVETQLNVVVTGTVAGETKACPKSLDLTIIEAPVPVPCNDAVGLLAYYACEDVTGSRTIVDSYTDKDLIAYSQGGPEDPLNNLTSGAGKIANAILADGHVVRAYATSDATYWKILSFTIRLWFNNTVAYNSSGPMLLLNGSPWGVFCGNGQWSLGRFSGGWSYYGQLVIPSGWHRVMMWYCDEDGNWGTQLNNDEPNTGFIGASIGGSGTGFEIQLQHPLGMTGEGYLDEIAVWEGVLSPAQRLTDWNSGSGKTYPDVPI